ncbi:hypothetical protein E4U43_003927 [Claviceps pusilla]|uniref:Uncharacterized protein n=1 Tax=Claviceps pusilla TaxID=123648 RepID=A0A9P7N6S3_9HYPO|nr:hypothetical protein E4U43_003927 [Claviceps pusilla]
MFWSVEHARGSSWRRYQQFLRRQWERKAVALGGSVFAGMCVSLFYLIAFHPVTFTKLTDEALTLTTPISISPAATADNGIILLHPEQHIYRKAKTLRFDWTITTETRSPDGVEKLIYLINGRSTSY